MLIDQKLAKNLHPLSDFNISCFRNLSLALENQHNTDIRKKINYLKNKLQI